MTRLFTMLLLFIALGAHRSAAQETINFATLEWPPYAGQEAEGGFVGAIMAAALKEENAEFSFRSLPWTRLLSTVTRPDSPYIGFYTASQSECDVAGGILSDSIDTFRLTLIAKKEGPFKAETFQTIPTSTVIGRVADYDNGQIFTKAEQENRFQTENGRSDEQLLKMLVYDRVDAIVMDFRVYQWLKETRSPEFSDTRDTGIALTKNLPFSACFRNDKAGQTAMATLNSGLKKIDRTIIRQAYFNTLSN